MERCFCKYVNIVTFYQNFATPASIPFFIFIAADFSFI